MKKILTESEISSMIEERKRTRNPEDDARLIHELEKELQRSPGNQRLTALVQAGKFLQYYSGR
jgi:hypothetical protein